MDTPPTAQSASDDPVLVAEKQALRGQLLQRRGQRTATERVAAQQANAAHLITALAGYPAVCAFLPLPSEPLAAALLDRLSDLGVRVLVPVVTGHQPLDWTDYSAARSAGLGVTAGPLGISQLDGPRLGPGQPADVPVMLVPALAIDRCGSRLGRGGGHYDRSLALIRTLTTTLPLLIGVIYDDELMAFVPRDALDVPVNRLVCPRSGVVDLG